MRSLENIVNPNEIRDFSTEELQLLCGDLRTFLIDSISKTGGHFAANLGVIELTVSLLHVFDFEQDKIVWDVGHQAYPYKVLTQRKEFFSTLRKKDGISGFPKRSESPYDHFGTGHSSTSISAVLGMLCSDFLQKNNLDKNYIAIIGDGALSAGQAFEALNNAGYLKLPLLVILNDNHMGIDPVAGALNEYLANLKTHEPNLFTRLGMDYVGPVDGHNVEELCKVLEACKESNRPTFLHIKTTKGKGFLPAEEEQTKWHATAGFDKIYPNAQNTASKGIKWQDVMGLKLAEMAAKEENLVAITPAMVSGSSLHFMQEKFPQRVFDVGIAEQHAVTFAAGMALQGSKVFCFIYSTFLQRAMDQVIHDVCLQNIPVVFCIDRAGLVGEDGPTHHGAFDIPLLRAIPNMVVMAPASQEDAQAMMDFALANPGQSPISIRYPRGIAYSNGLFSKKIELGKAIEVQKGSKVALLVFGDLLPIALQTADLLQQKGIRPSIVNMRFVKPLDEGLLKEYCSEHTLLCTFENGSKLGGAGTAVAEWLMDNSPETKLLRLGLPDAFIEHGSVAEQMHTVGLYAENVVEQIDLKMG